MPAPVITIKKSDISLRKKSPLISKTVAGNPLNPIKCGVYVRDNPPFLRSLNDSYVDLVSTPFPFVKGETFGLKNAKAPDHPKPTLPHAKRETELAVLRTGTTPQQGLRVPKPNTEKRMAVLQRWKLAKLQSGRRGRRETWEKRRKPPTAGTKSLAIQVGWPVTARSVVTSLDRGRSRLGPPLRRATLDRPANQYRTGILPALPLVH